MTAGIGDTATREAIREAVLEVERAASEAAGSLRGLNPRDKDLHRVLADVRKSVAAIEFECMAMRRWV
jgi:hypothetical protein